MTSPGLIQTLKLKEYCTLIKIYNLYIFYRLYFVQKVLMNFLGSIHKAYYIVFNLHVKLIKIQFAGIEFLKYIDSHFITLLK